MTARFLLTAALGLFLISGCESSPGPDAERAPLDYDALAEFLLERLALQPGERRGRRRDRPGRLVGGR